MRKIIFDTDPGIDDAFAIITAMKDPNIEVLGLCSVAGNKGIEYTTTNCLKLIELMNYNCMAYKGASESLLKVAEDAGDTHGTDGLGGVDLPYDPNKLSDIHAVDFILEQVKKYPNEIEIIAIGPVTNIALAIEQDRDTMKQVKAIYSMGGGVFRGNSTPVAEFNYWYDAKAVDIMYSLGVDVPIHMIGLDVTHGSIVTVTDLEFMKMVGGDLGELLYDMVIPYVQAYWKYSHYLGCVIHDLLCVVYAIKPDVCGDVHHANLRTSTSGITVGQTVVDLVDSWKLPKNAYVPMSVDTKEYVSEFFRIVFGEDVKNKYRKHVLKCEN